MLQMVVGKPHSYKTYAGAVRKLTEQTGGTENYRGLIAVTEDGRFVPVVINPPPFAVTSLIHNSVMVIT